MKNVFRGGFRTGNGKFTCINGTYPFAKLRVEDKIYLETWPWLRKKTYVFELEEVLMKIGVLSLGDSIQIIHNKPDYPIYIYFHAFQLEAIRALLKSKGVILEECKKTKAQKALKLALKIYMSIFLTIWFGGLLFFLALLVCRACGLI